MPKLTTDLGLARLDWCDEDLLLVEFDALGSELTNEVGHFRAEGEHFHDGVELRVYLIQVVILISQCHRDVLIEATDGFLQHLRMGVQQRLEVGFVVLRERHTLRLITSLP